MPVPACPRGVDQRWRKHRRKIQACCNIASVVRERVRRELSILGLKCRQTRTTAVGLATKVTGNCHKNRFLFTEFVIEPESMGIERFVIIVGIHAHVRLRPWGNLSWLQVDLRNVRGNRAYAAWWDYSARKRCPEEGAVGVLQCCKWIVNRN